MAFDWTSLIGPVIGAAAGGGDETQTTTSTSTPWGPAQPYMLRNLEDTEKLGNYYKANPFNQQQTEQYSNLFGDIGNFRNNIAPGLMNFANTGMNSNYQRARVDRPGGVAGYGGTNSARMGSPLPSGGSGGLLGPFSVAPSGGSSGGLLDLNGAQNPFANGGVTQNPQTVNEQMIEALKAEIGLGNSPGNDAGDNQSAGGASGYGGVWGGNPLANASTTGLTAALLAGPAALAAFVASNWGKLTDEQKAQVAMYSSGEGGYGTNAGMVGAPNSAQAQAIADTFARDFAGYASGGGSAGNGGGVGGLDAGGSPDGYW